MKNKRGWEHGCRVIDAMNTIMRSLNDEDWFAVWLTCGVPDGDFTLESIKRDYPNDEEFDCRFNKLSALFIKVLGKQAAKIVMEEEEGILTRKIKWDTKAILYVGQDTNA